MTPPPPRLRITSLVTASLLLTGVGFAATMPYQGIVAIEALGISNGNFALILTIGSLIGALVSVILGWLSDRIEDRRLIVIAVAVMSALGPALMWVVREPWAFVAMTCVLGPLGGAVYSQTLAFARAYIAGRGGSKVDFMMTLIRAVFAVSWVITPPFAGWIAAKYTVFDPYAVAALASIACIVILLVLFRDPDTKIADAHTGPASEPPARGIPVFMLIGFVGVVALSTATRLNGIATPLAIVTHWNGTVADVGIYAALAALIEIPLMIGWAYATRVAPVPVLIAVAGIVFGLYVFLAGNVTSVAGLLWLQGLNALGTAGLMSLPISYLQEAIKGRVGLSTSLLDVSFVASNLLAGAAFALFTAQGSYLPIFDVAATAAGSGAAIMLLAFAMGRRTVGHHSR